jgi:hypothetical protein
MRPLLLLILGLFMSLTAYAQDVKKRLTFEVYAGFGMRIY